MIAVGNEELAQMPMLGKTIRCWICGQEHRVEYGEKVLEDGTKVPCRTIAFMRCGQQSYLCGIGGKEWRPKKAREEVGRV